MRIVRSPARYVDSAVSERVLGWRIQNQIVGVRPNVEVLSVDGDFSSAGGALCDDLRQQDTVVELMSIDTICYRCSVEVDDLFVYTCTLTFCLACCCYKITVGGDRQIAKIIYKL